jgi:glutathione S-transferase
MSSSTLIDVATARAARGLRLVVLGTLPSPWSEAAKGLFHLRGVPFLAVRFRRGDEELAAWSGGARNAPVAFYEDEPPRTGWSEILALAQRLGNPDAPALIPADPELRVRLHGLAHELAGEDGFGWNARLLMIDGSLASGGARSFPLLAAQYLAPRYGYSPERAHVALARMRAVLALFDQQLARSRAAGHAYLLGERVTALDIYLATFLTPVVGLSEADCPQLRPEARQAFDYLHELAGGDVPPALAAHRAVLFERRHLPWPIEL